MSAGAAPAESDGPEQGLDEATGEGRCLVVGYDGEEASSRAVRWAAEQLAPGGRLVIVNASRPLHAPASPLSSDPERRRLGRALLDELVLDGDDALLDTLVHREVDDDDPVTALTRVAARCHADGIVVGHERHFRLHRAIGTVTTELLARSTVPVTVVPAGP